ncbi:ATP-binding protein [Photobacterium rosenbergii]|uniref:histidine kinase n=1 Tax=Photobacterium rosenbergii TaxID=294936 RepID=A0ABU3ZF10_9GAMM|nr:ATP-binding protein [Photobacterium rosenbergii]MDV5168694.1 ATP-binding protein [Photobacterium rosenbergii]
MTLRTKTIFGIALIEALVLAVLIFTGLKWLKTSNDSRLETGSKQLVSVFASASRDAVLATDLAYLDSFAQSITAEHNLVYVRITDRNGLELTRHGDYQNVTTHNLPSEVHDGVYDVCSEIVVAGEYYGKVEMGVRVKDFQALMSQATRMSLLIALIEMTLVAIFSFALGTYLLRRLEQLKKGVEQVGEIGPGGQITITGNDEVTRVGEAFNQMSLSLANAQADLAKKHQQQIALTEKVTELAQVAEHARDVIIITDAKGCITWVNPAFEALTGYSAKEVLGRQPGELLQGKGTDSETVTQMSDALAEKKAIKVELLNYTKQGQAYWVEMDISPVLNDAGEVVRFIAVERDITERRQVNKRLEEALEQATKANTAKSEFLANMSHEIRTPMNAVMGLSEMLLDSEVTSEQREKLKIINQSAENLVAIINDILDYSKIEAGKLTLNDAPFDLREVLEQAVELSAYQAKNKGLPVILDMTPSINTQVIGDKGRLNQILLNLLGNAVKFTPKGYVKLSVKEDLSGQTPTFRFTVEDTGMGIPAERLPFIMDKFEQVDNSATREFEGTGLGLAICNHLVALFGGKLQVESEEGKGSTFSFLIGFKPQASYVAGTFDVIARADNSHFVDESKLPVLTVLLAEDSQVNRMLVEAMLANSNLKLIFAKDGVEAVELYQQHQPDMVITDISMPNKDGYAVTKEIREMQQSSQSNWCPIIALSAHAMLEEQENCHQRGLDDYLTKPVKKNELVAMIAKWGDLADSAPECSSRYV